MSSLLSQARLWALLPLFACGGGPESEPPVPSDAPDYVLVLVAGLRSDLGESRGAEAAFLEGLGREPSHSWSRAYAQSVSTSVSFGSVLAGKYPSAIPLCGRGGPGSTPAWCASYPPDTPSLPVVLGHYGYESIWLHDNSLEGEAFSEVFGQVQGFEGSPSEVALGMATSLSSWWQGQALVPRIAVLTLGDLLAEREELAAALRASPGDAYRQEARALGTRLGQVLDGLDTTPWIVVAGLHGQDLGESQPSRRMPLSPFFHDILLERTVHVPLWAFGPGEGGSDAIVEIRQILPTLLGLSGAELPAGAAGSLLDPLSGPVTPQAYAEFGDMLALWRGDHVFTLRSMAHNSTSLNPDLTQALREAEPTSAVFALHRIAEDPLQERNLSQSHQAQAQAMREALTEVRTTDGALPRKQLPPAQLQILRQPGAGYW